MYVKETGKKLGHTIWNSPGWVMTATCEDFAVMYPGTDTWTTYTGPMAYDNCLSDLYDAGLTGAYYEVQNYWGTSCNGLEHSCGLSA
jgi:hypothetical protein